MPHSEAYVLGNLGDESPFDYGGFIVYLVVEDDGHRYVYAERWDEPAEDEGDVYEVYRFEVEPDAMKDLSWVAGSDTGNWRSIADFVGTTEDEIALMAASENPLERAEVYRMVGEYHGWDNLDSYPERYARSEMEKRWPQFA